MGNEPLSGAPGSKNVTLKAYSIDETPVTNQQFREFAKDTKYRTEAELFNWSFVLNSTLSAAVLEESDQVIQSAPHWVAVADAWWRKPEGRDSSLTGRWETYPAVHISWNDAKTFCEWAGKRMPTEAEWENAARGKRKSSLYPFGDGKNPLGPNGEWAMNIWQGDFPSTNTAEDGYHGLAPVRAYPPNSYGVYSTVGNVWEWTSDPFPTQNPKDDQWTLKGGSYIDSVDGSFNHKSTVVTRMGNTKDSGSHNIGFRCASGRGGGGRKKPVDQEKIQSIMAEGGIEAVQKYLADTGQNAQVMTPAMLKEKQAEIKRMKAEMGMSDEKVEL